MCWNKEVSLNTYISSMVILALVYYNNKYTQYKFPSLQGSIFKYLFFISFITMQLVEYFLWKNINNVRANHLISTIGLSVLFLQPLFAILGFTTGKIKQPMLIAYLIFVLFYIFYRYFINPLKAVTRVAKDGHLSWDWFVTRGWESIFVLIWIGFFLAGLGGDGNWSRPLIGSLLLIWSVILFYKTNTWGSLWCWIANIVLLYYLFELLIIKPYREHGFCGIK